MQNIFQVIDGNTELAICKVSGEDAWDALVNLAKALGFDHVDQLLESKHLDIVEHEGNMIYNYYTKAD